MNEDTLKGQWTQVKGKVRRRDEDRDEGGGVRGIVLKSCPPLVLSLS